MKYNQVSQAGAGVTNEYKLKLPQAIIPQMLDELCTAVPTPVTGGTGGDIAAIPVSAQPVYSVQHQS